MTKFFFFSVIGILLITHLCKGNTDDYSSDKIFLKYKGSNCLYPENVIENNKFEIASDQCDKVAHDNEFVLESYIPYLCTGKFIWQSFTNGRLRTQNGLCLKTHKNFLVASTCSPEKNEPSEVWRIDEEKRLKNESNKCAQVAGNKLFIFTCNSLSSKEFEIKPFAQEELNLMKTRYVHESLQNLNTENVEKSLAKSDTLISSYNELKKEIDYILKTEEQMREEKEKIIHLMDDVKSLINTSSSLSNYGTGALMKIYDSIDINKKNSLISVPLEKLLVNEHLLNELGIEEGEIKIIIQTFLNTPESNNYTFVAKDVTGSLIIKLDNKEIISNVDVQIDNTMSSPLIYLPKNVLVPLYIEISSKSVKGKYSQQKPSFTLFWSSKNLPEQVINSLYLHTTIFDNICYIPFQKKIDCSTTFESITRQNEEFQFLCPSECSVKEKKETQKRDNPRFSSCYELKSSICRSAIFSNFLPEESEGIVKVMVKNVKNQEGNYEPCGVVLPTNAYDSTFNGITDIKLVDMDDFFFNYDVNRDLYKGYKGIVTDDKHSLLTKRDLSNRYITDIDINCDNDLKENYEFSTGSFIIKRITPSDLHKKENTIVVDAFALFEKFNNDKQIPIHLSEWTKKTCNNIQLYIKYGKPNDIMNYPSTLLSCDDTFENIHFDHSDVIVARCLPSCSVEKDVLGSYIYAPPSPICKSAIHSGIITSMGGIIEIRKLNNITQSFSSTMSITRNGIKALIADNKYKDSYYVTKPNGTLCSFPTSSSSFQMSKLISSQSKEDALSSFIQVNSHMLDTPPVVLVHEKHAVLQNQLYNMHNWYNTDSYKKEILLNESLGGKSIQKLYNPHTDGQYIQEGLNVRGDEKMANEVKTFEQNYGKDREGFQKLVTKHENIFSNLFSKKSAISYLNKKLAGVRAEQRNYESFLKIYESATSSLIKQFSIITGEKKFVIDRLERTLKNVKAITVETFEEEYRSVNINDNYIIIDSNNIRKASNWRIEKFRNGNPFSSITNDNFFVKSSEELYGSYILYRYTKLSKGFISLDVKIPYEGNFGVIFKYKNSSNYTNFIINKTESYFIEIKEGNESKQISYQKMNSNSSNQLGNWTKIFIEFGYKNVRAYINGKFTSGYETKNDASGLLGFGINNCKEKIYIDKIVIGSLDQAKHYKNGIPKRNIKESFSYQSGKIKVEMGEDKDKKNVEKEYTSKCKKFEENFLFPLDTNWVVPMRSSWRVQGEFQLSSIWEHIGVHAGKEVTVERDEDDTKRRGKPESEGSYLCGTQKPSEGNLVIPSIILLKKQNICADMKSFTFHSSINLGKFSKSGIIFRVLSSDDFLSVILDISQLTGKVYLLKISNGIPYQLNTPTHIPIREDTWYNLSLSYDGSNVHITLNDEHVLTSKFNEHAKELGNVGLIVLSGESRFKNIIFVPQ
ncbi:LCCL domain-containing protein, putative [Plasmodium ovale]|uniref:LCCL domain-containing protein, putative n=1 Tax=Plasmodium ovale TaxID=36330 RepID=A0A1C3KQ62_PLAOA|nr:LCCL domain-containing protein, putative [Plasmodium ovale]